MQCNPEEGFTGEQITRDENASPSLTYFYYVNRIALDYERKDKTVNFTIILVINISMYP